MAEAGAYKLIQKTGSEEALSEYLARYGWELKDRFGAAIFYHREDSDLLIEARMLSRFYIIYELDKPLANCRE